MKKLMSIMMAIAMIFSLTTVAFADEVTLQEDKTGQGNVDVIGTVEPITTLNVDVPLTVNFTIKADRTIEWAEAKITSNCPAPLDVKVLSTAPATLTQDEINAGYVDAPALVADDAFADWDNLTKAQTRSNIAISINDMNLSIPDQIIGELASGFSAPTELSLVGSAFYGKAWPNTANQLFKYNMVLEFSMK
jgi:hypothetical protein